MRRSATQSAPCRGSGRPPVASEFLSICIFVYMSVILLVVFLSSCCIESYIHLRWRLYVWHLYAFLCLLHQALYMSVWLVILLLFFMSVPGLHQVDCLSVLLFICLCVCFYVCPTVVSGPVRAHIEPRQPYYITCNLSICLSVYLSVLPLCICLSSYWLVVCFLLHRVLSMSARVFICLSFCCLSVTLLLH